MVAGGTSGGRSHRGDCLAPGLMHAGNGRSSHFYPLPEGTILFQHHISQDEPQQREGEEGVGEGGGGGTQIIPPFLVGCCCMLWYGGRLASQSVGIINHGIGWLVYASGLFLLVMCSAVLLVRRRRRRRGRGGYCSTHARHARMQARTVMRVGSGWWKDFKGECWLLMLFWLFCCVTLLLMGAQVSNKRTRSLTI